MGGALSGEGTLVSRRFDSTRTTRGRTSRVGTRCRGRLNNIRSRGGRVVGRTEAGTGTRCGGVVSHTRTSTSGVGTRTGGTSSFRYRGTEDTIGRRVTTLTVRATRGIVNGGIDTRASDRLCGGFLGRDDSRGW